MVRSAASEVLSTPLKPESVAGLDCPLVQEVIESLRNEIAELEGRNARLELRFAEEDD
jgi:hypothetical protein